MEGALPAVRVRIPCNDARDYYDRLAGHVAAKGLRIPSEHRRPIGSRLRIALELRNGETLCGDAVVEGHVQLDARAGLSVRFLAPPCPEEPTPVGAEDLVADGGDEPLAPTAPGGDASRGADEPLAPARFDPFAGVAELDPLAVPEVAPAPPPEDPGASAEILASANRQVARLLRGVVALSALALLLAGAGYVVGLRLARHGSPQAIAAARVASADRLLGDGKILGRDGALEQLLAARDLRPADPEIAERLSRLASLLESLGASAIDRGDLAVASVHLSAASLAEPTRESVRAKLAYLAAKEHADEAPARPAPKARKKKR